MLKVLCNGIFVFPLTALFNHLNLVLCCWSWRCVLRNSRDTHQHPYKITQLASFEYQHTRKEAETPREKNLPLHLQEEHIEILLTDDICILRATLSVSILIAMVITSA